MRMDGMNVQLANLIMTLRTTGWCGRLR
jgi:hypothetical protein